MAVGCWQRRLCIAERKTSHSKAVEGYNNYCKAKIRPGMKESGVRKEILLVFCVYWESLCVRACVWGVRIGLTCRKE